MYPSGRPPGWATEAGFERIELLNEPTAAALVTVQDVLTPEPTRVLVFDLGGGTFDIALLEASRDADGYLFDTLIVDGDTHLGGDDIDASFARWLRQQMKEQFSVAIEDDDYRVRDSLRTAAEHAKVALSTADVVEAEVELPGVGVYRVPVTRSQLEQCAAPVLERTRTIVREAVEEIGRRSWTELDEVILVGGQSLIPAVRRQVAELWGREPRSIAEPQLAVALGAGEYAHMLSLGQARFHERTLINVLALPLGIRLDENRFEPLVAANKTVPHRSDPYAVTITEDNQTKITVEVLQGRRGAETADDCVLLEVIELETLPAPAGSPRFEIQFDVQDDATLRVIVLDPRRALPVVREIGHRPRILTMRQEEDAR
jgi:molecular chaperone DnaK